jgi:hypothetical protein
MPLQPLQYESPRRRRTRWTWRDAVRMALHFILISWMLIWLMVVGIHLLDPRGGQALIGPPWTMQERLRAVAFDVAMLVPAVVALVVVRRYTTVKKALEGASMAQERNTSGRSEYII